MWLRSTLVTVTAAIVTAAMVFTALQFRPDARPEHVSGAGSGRMQFNNSGPWYTAHEGTEFILDWVKEPDSLADLQRTSDMSAIAQVVSVEYANEVLAPGDVTPVERVQFVTRASLTRAPKTFVVLRFGDRMTHAEGDPFYSVGETYLLTMDERRANTYVRSAAAGRIFVAPNGTLVATDHHDSVSRQIVSSPPQSVSNSIKG